MVVMSIPIAGRLAFISREGNYLNLYNNFTLFTVTVPVLIIHHYTLCITRHRGGTQIQVGLERKKEGKPS